jgi:cytochrome c oxidase subunit 3
MSPTVLDTPPDIATRKPPPPPPVRYGGGGGGSSGGDSDGSHRHDRSKTAIFGMWIALVPILMLFLAFVSAYIVRHGLGTEWTRGTMPSIVYVNTLVLWASSAMLERSRALDRRHQNARPWVGVTLVLGITFVIGQALAWQELKHRGLSFSATPYASFFFLLTVAHAIHVFGGLAGLVAATLWPRQGWHGQPLELVLRVNAIYWHFLGVLWLLLLAVLRFWS